MSGALPKAKTNGGCQSNIQADRQNGNDRHPTCHGLFAILFDGLKVPDTLGAVQGTFRKLIIRAGVAQAASGDGI